MPLKRLLTVSALFLTTVAAPRAQACYAVVVGREASADGSVLVGHNEVNGGRRILNFRRIPRLRGEKGARTRLWRGGELDDVEETHAFLWSENPGLEFSDGYLNEWGVAIVSNACSTREDNYRTLGKRGEIRHGGIGYMLRRIVAQRAKTAREGVRIAGDLIERFGYVDSGRTYVIADPGEAWLLAVVRGRRWVARRVPDDSVVLLPNVHIIDRVDLDDGTNFLASPDLVSYAVKRGWFDPEEGEPFRFHRVYAPDRSRAPDPRQRLGQRLVRATPSPPVGESLPFAVKPARKLTVRAVIEILRNRSGPVPICTPYVQEGAVFQLRSDLPREIGCIYWRTTAEPSTSVLTPWYLGIAETPKSYFLPGDIKTQLTLKRHFRPPPATFAPVSGHAWWVFKGVQDLVHVDFEDRIRIVRPVWEDFEDRVFREQAAVEKEALALREKDKKACRAHLTRLCASLAAEAMRKSVALSKQLSGGGPGED